VDWRGPAWERLCEAQALSFGLRDYPPEELEVWLKHALRADPDTGGWRGVLGALHAELVEKNFIQEGWWETFLADIADDIERAPDQAGGDADPSANPSTTDSGAELNG